MYSHTHTLHWFFIKCYLVPKNCIFICLVWPNGDIQLGILHPTRKKAKYMPRTRICTLIVFDRNYLKRWTQTLQVGQAKVWQILNPARNWAYTNCTKPWQIIICTFWEAISYIQLPFLKKAWIRKLQWSSMLGNYFT